MSDSAQEPTMEEILASIRRIISEDDVPEATAEATPPHVDEPPAPVVEEPAPPAPPAPAAVAEPEPAPEEEDDALELTEKVETHGDLDVMSSAPAAPAPEPPPAPPAPPPPAASALVSAPAAAAAAAAFGRLSSATLVPAGGPTLEEIVRDMLRPMLQQWLDDNLAGIVQTAVDAEVARIARGG